MLLPSSRNRWTYPPGLGESDRLFKRSPRRGLSARPFGDGSIEDADRDQLRNAPGSLSSRPRRAEQTTGLRGPGLGKADTGEGQVTWPLPEVRRRSFLRAGHRPIGPPCSSGDVALLETDARLGLGGLGCHPRHAGCVGSSRDGADRLEGCLGRARGLPGQGQVRHEGAERLASEAKRGGGRVSSLELAARLDEVARLVPDQAEQPARQVPGASTFSASRACRLFQHPPAERLGLGSGTGRNEAKPEHRRRGDDRHGLSGVARCLERRAQGLDSARPLAGSELRRPQREEGQRPDRVVRAEQLEASACEVLGVGFAWEERRQERPKRIQPPLCRSTGARR